MGVSSVGECVHREAQPFHFLSDLGVSPPTLVMFQKQMQSESRSFVRVLSTWVRDPHLVEEGEMVWRSHLPVSATWLCLCNYIVTA